jgi:PEP-CTERM motif
MKRLLKTALLATALAVTGQAQAGHVVVYQGTTYAFSAATTGDSSAAADIRNGYANPASNYAQGMATSETHTFTANGTTASTEVTTTSLAVPGRTSSAASYSSLDTGIMRAHTIQTPPTAYGYPLASTITTLADTVFFTNSSGNAINLDVTWSFEGTAYAFEPNTATGLGSLNLAGCSTCSNNLGQNISFSGTGNTASIAAYSFFNESGVYSVYDQYSGQALNPLDFSVLNNSNGIGSIIRTTLVIPTGETSLGFNVYLNLDTRAASIMDFGHTAKFGFGPLANGLSFTSDSGVFLRGNVAAAVPEPATWAMMLFGFALVGSAVRRRNAKIASLA